MKTKSRKDKELETLLVDLIKETNRLEKYFKEITQTQFGYANGHTKKGGDLLIDETHCDCGQTWHAIGRIQ